MATVSASKLFVTTYHLITSNCGGICMLGFIYKDFNSVYFCSKLILLVTVIIFRQDLTKNMLLWPTDAAVHYGGHYILP